jgi:hypothetical protein
MKVIPFDDQTTELARYCSTRSVTLVDSYLADCDQIGQMVATKEEKGYKIYRKFAAFWGDFEAFAFIDSDTHILGYIGDLHEIYKNSGTDILFYARSSPDRNFKEGYLKDLAGAANVGGNEGFNAGFFLTRRELFSLPFLAGLSAHGNWLRRVLTRGHEQAFLNYALAVTGTQAGMVHRASARYSAPWNAQDPIIESDTGFIYQSDRQRRPILILHWGGALWGKGPNARLVGMFSTPPVK